MGTPIGEDVELNPGDLVDVFYEVKPGNDVLVDLAISKVKRDLAADPRWHYQGSRWEEYEDPDFGGTVRLIVFTVQVADPAKVTGEDPGQVQLAGVLNPRTIVAVVGLVSAAIIAASAAAYMIYKGHAVKSIVENPNVSDQVKVAALGALTKSNLGDTLKSLGHSLVIVAVLVSLLWFLSKSHLVERVLPAPGA